MQHERETILTRANAPAIIAAFLAGARLRDQSFEFEEGEGTVRVILANAHNAELTRLRLQDYLLRLVHPGVEIVVVSKPEPAAP